MSPFLGQLSTAPREARSTFQVADFEPSFDLRGDGLTAPQREALRSVLAATAVIGRLLADECFAGCVEDVRAAADRHAAAGIAATLYVSRGRRGLLGQVVADLIEHAAAGSEGRERASMVAAVIATTEPEPLEEPAGRQRTYLVDEPFVARVARGADALAASSRTDCKHERADLARLLRRAVRAPGPAA